MRQRVEHAGGGGEGGARWRIERVATRGEMAGQMRDEVDAARAIASAAARRTLAGDEVGEDGLGNLAADGSILDERDHLGQHLWRQANVAKVNSALLREIEGRAPETPSESRRSRTRGRHDGASEAERAGVQRGGGGGRWRIARRAAASLPNSNRAPCKWR